MTHDLRPSHSGRRAFLKNGMLVLTAASVRPSLLCADEQTGPVKIGLVTDLHYADKPPKGTRHYRETLAKLEEAAKQFEQEKVGLLVELGDLIDAADAVETEIQYLARINREFAAIGKDRHYVLGNHCVDTLKKEEFLAGVEQEKSYYSFDHKGFHFIVLDSCFRSDGLPYGRKNSKWNDANIPAKELEWLKADLQSTNRQVVVFAHQRLDVSTDHGVKNNGDVRGLLEDSGKVLAVFQGHSHRNDLKEIKGIYYCTLVAMVEGSGAENNGYSLMVIEPDGTLKIKGFRQQEDYVWDQRT